MDRVKESSREFMWRWGTIFRRADVDPDSPVQIDEYTG